MKKALPCILMLVSTVTTTFSQQISNGGLENWNINVTNNTEEPDSFVVSPAIIGPDTFVVKTTDAHSGQYAAEFRRFLLFPPSPAPGELYYSSNYGPGIGWPFTWRPSKLTFWYKYLPDGNDEARVLIYLFNGGSMTNIGSGTLFISTSDTVYTFAELPINYSSANNPDSITLTFEASTMSVISFNTKLYVDDIALDYSTGLEEIENNRLAIYPNPASNEFKIQNSEFRIEKVEIFDALGQSVFIQQPGAKSAELFIDVSNLAKEFIWCGLLKV